MDLLNIQPNVVRATLNDKIFLIYGVPGSRKTSVAAKFPDHLIAGFEIGYSFIEGATAQPLQTWNDFRKFLRELNRPEVKARYKTIVIDTISLMVSACEQYVLTNMNIEHESQKAFGEAYTRIKREFEKALLSIPQMGYGLIMIAHSEETEDADGFSAKIQLNKRSTAIAKGLADFILYTSKEPRDGSEGRPEDETVYAYSNVSAVETKSRARYFPRRFEFTYENLVDALEEAVEKQKEAEGIEYNVKADKNVAAEILHKRKEINFEELQANTVTLAKELYETSVASSVDEILIEMMPEGLTISKLTKAHSDLLENLYDQLVELKEKLG